MFGFSGVEFRVWKRRFGISGLEFRVWGFVLGASCLEFRAWSFSVSGWGFGLDPTYTKKV